MRTNLWIVFLVVSAFLGFLLGYSVSSYTGVQQKSGDYSLETSGYGEESDGDAGGYGGGGDAKGDAGGGASDGLDQETLDYYKNLYKDEQQQE